MSFSIPQLQEAYRQMVIIRGFEETVRNLYMDGKIRGSFHPCVGQEATAVGIGLALRKEDMMTCTYRGHGHAIAKGLDVNAAMAEMLGRSTGCSHGKGGSMHFTDLSVGLLGANAIVAAGIPHAAGAALAAKMQGKDNVALSVFGEGAVNQGVFHEALNLAVVWNLPLILVCENNLYSEMTPSHETTSTPETYRRAQAYGMPASEVDGNDVEAMFNAVAQAAADARVGKGPSYIEARTYRLWGHMMGDPEVYRTKEEVLKARENDPILRLKQKLVNLGVSESEAASIEQDAQGRIRQALEFAQNSPIPNPRDALTEVFA
jgi:acetoin:2,6-dichlorophenolindophenol oxidoreductase subunit alpha